MTERWPRWAVATLLLLTAGLYLWNLSASGYGNPYYAAAAQAGARSWSAWFFGALDANNFVTVDKPPAALWITGLSVRWFGLSSWSVLAPQALMGVASVFVLYATMRRTIAEPRQGAAAGLLAGAVLAGTPVAALMFRVNNPDALLVLLLTTAAYCLARAVRAASWRWLVAVGLVLGTAFLTKMLQAFLVAPGFAAAYLCAAASWQQRLRHLAIAALALLVGAGWWVLVVSVLPAGSRPYIGGSTDDSVFDLAFGYNGLNRVLGTPGARTPRAGPGAGRLFGGEMGNDISWLLPVAVFVTLFGVLLVVTRRLPRDETAALVAWGGWLAVTGTVLSVMSGTEHPYYTVALAPAIAALIGLGAVWGWRLLPGTSGRLALTAMVVIAAGWSANLLHRNHIGPAWLVVAGSGSLGAALLLAGLLRTATSLGVCAGLLGMTGFTVMTAHSAVPAPNWTGDEATNGHLADLLEHASTRWSAATNGAQSAAALELATGTSVLAVGGFSTDPVPTLPQFIAHLQAGDIAYYVEAGAAHTHGSVIRSEAHGTSVTRQIADWVAAHYRAEPVGDSMVYRLR